MTVRIKPNNNQPSEWIIPQSQLVGVINVANISCTLQRPTGSPTTLSITQLATNDFFTSYSFIDSDPFGTYVFRWRCSNPLLGVDDSVILEPAGVGIAF